MGLMEMETACYVYEANSVPPVIVGKYWIENGVGKFVYGKSYLNNPRAFAIDPINMPLIEAEFIPKHGKDRFNVLSDAGVGNWGRRLIMATHTKTPRNAVEWLLSASGRGAGSLLFSNSRTEIKPVTSPITVNQLGDYIRIVQSLTTSADHFKIPKEFIKLVEHGQSMGGTRPKALVMHNGIEYIAKFNRGDDVLSDVSLIENATMTLAKKCGIEVAETWCMDLGNKGNVLMVKRFDRRPGHLSRTHYISAQSLLNFSQINVNDYATDYSYAGIAKKIMAICAQPQDDARQLFRRMVFNGMIGNNGDHLGKHGFLMINRAKQKYRLSPAFDVLPQHEGHPQMLAIDCGKHGQLASYENLLSQASQFYLSQQEALLIIKEIREHVVDYRKFFSDMGVSNHDLSILEPCFALAVKGG